MNQTFAYGAGVLFGSMTMFINADMYLMLIIPASGFMFLVLGVGLETFLSENTAEELEFNE